MRRFQEPEFDTARVCDVLTFAAEFKREGYMFVNINATTCGDHCDLLYAFRSSQDAPGLTGKTVSVRPDDVVPSITSLYPAAFVFENEAHDLFGIEFSGISIDYDGEFYTLSVAYPMNPKAAAAPEADDARGEQ